MRTTIQTSLLIALTSPLAAAQGPSWAEGFAHSWMNLTVTELCAFDSGEGERLYVCCKDQFQNGAPSVVRRHDGNLYDGFQVPVAGRVLASATWDDGTGPALYLAGAFTSIGGVAASSIARFDGNTFTPLGAGVAGGVDALAVHDDGGGPALYAVGTISGAGGSPTNGIARWDGATWSGVGSLPGLPTDVVSFDDGTGSALYVSGDFLGPGATDPNVARWDGSTWTFLPFLNSGTANALAVHDDGGGAALYVANSALNQVVRWNGSFFTTVGPSFNGAVRDLESSSVGGAGLIALGEFTAIGGSTARVAARWAGGAWSPLSNSLSASTCNPTAHAIGRFDPAGGPPVVVIGGCFYGSSASAASPPFAWDGVRLAGVLAGHGTAATVAAQLTYDDGGGERLYAAGSFERAGHVDASRVARWNGASWGRVGNGLGSAVETLAVHDDGAGTRLWAGGNFGVARWDGAAWTQASTGLGSGPQVHALAVHDAGSGPTLYAAFTRFVGFDYVDRVARWDGAGWTDVGDEFSDSVLALASFDDGAGPQLYAAGAFLACGATPLPRFARWDGAAWASPGSGPDGIVRQLFAFDDGGGPALFAGGGFSSAGAVPAAGVALWRGGAWSQPGGGLGSTVSAFTVHDDGAGARLYAGGSFGAATPTGIARRVASWDGVAWAPLASGIVGNGASVASLGSYRPAWARSARLSAGGFFSRAGDELSSNFAVWGADDDGVAVCFGDGVLAACPCANASAVGAGVGCANSTGAGGALRSLGEASLSVDTFALLGTDMPDSFVTYYQTTGVQPFGAGVALDDGLGCVLGTAVRLGTVLNQGGSSGVPNAQFPAALSVAGLLPAAGGTRVYQARYRDLAGPCGTLANRTNAIAVTWRP